MTGGAAAATDLPPAGRPWWRPGWRWPAGLVILLYVLGHVVEVTLALESGRAYLALRDWWASPLGRCASAVVVISVVAHGAFGLLAAWAGVVGEPERLDDPRSRAAVWFVVVAVSVPAVALTLWPWVRTW